MSAVHPKAMPVMLTLWATRWLDNDHKDPWQVRRGLDRMSIMNFSSMFSGPAAFLGALRRDGAPSSSVASACLAHISVSAQHCRRRGHLWRAFS
jgi:hypothetical protein